MNLYLQKEYWNRSSYAVVNIDSSGKNQLQLLRKGFEKFFSLPMNIKMKYWLGDAPIPFRGYFPPLKQNYDSKMQYKDFKEGYDMGFDLLSQEDRIKEYKHFFGPNIFPDEIPEIKEPVSHCLKFFHHLSQTIRNHIYKDLKNKEFNTLHSKFFFNRPVNTLRFLNYNPSNFSRKNVLSTPLVKHKDPGLFTFIYTNQPGLEFYDFNTKIWEKVLTNENQLIVFWGLFLEFVTAGNYRATLHRVKELSEKKISICFFHNPNYDACFKRNSHNAIEAGRQIFCCSIGYDGDEEALYNDHITKRLW